VSTDDAPETVHSAAPWLADLEARVREAVAEIGRLRQDNRRLEKELGKLRKAAGGNGGAAMWEQERAEVRTRLERLTAHLEGVLGPGADAECSQAEATPPGPAS
jgi:hypothetical protein